jgi:hypothetical protein
LFGRSTLLGLVNASESEFYTNKEKKNECEKHNLYDQSVKFYNDETSYIGGRSAGCKGNIFPGESDFVQKFLSI